MKVIFSSAWVFTLMLFHAIFLPQKSIPTTFLTFLTLRTWTKTHLDLQLKCCTSELAQGFLQEMWSEDVQVYQTLCSGLGLPRKTCVLRPGARHGQSQQARHYGQVRSCRYTWVRAGLEGCLKNNWKYHKTSGNWIHWVKTTGNEPKQQIWSPPYLQYCWSFLDLCSPWPPMQGAQLSFRVPFSKTQLWLTFTLLRAYFT